jgi:RNA polymerase sigma-70 factor, ECF subfamily
VVLTRDLAVAKVTDLFTSWYAQAVRHSFHICGSVDLAEEFTQEAFAELFRNLREGAAIEHPRAWILQTVRNQAAKHRRSQERHPVRRIADDELELVAPQNGHHEISPVASNTLSDHLDGLSKREEQAILLRAQGMKYVQIAEHMGISTNSVGTLVLRAARKIRKSFQQQTSRTTKVAAL